MPLLSQGLLAKHVTDKLLVIVFNGKSETWIFHGT
jgi:hypothetical protein